jgi:hypothetical protein
MGDEDLYKVEHGGAGKKGSGTEWLEAMNRFEACCEGTGIPGGTVEKIVDMHEDMKEPVLMFIKLAGCCYR